MAQGKSGPAFHAKDGRQHKDPGKSAGEMQAPKGSTKGSKGPRASKEDLVAKLKAQAKKD
jgi:hypothetical protein